MGLALGLKPSEPRKSTLPHAVLPSLDLTSACPRAASLDYEGTLSR